MSKFTASMFESIKETLETQKTGNGNFKDILKTEPGSSYIVRFVPNMKEPNRTIHKYFHHGWNSHVTGQYTTTLCPTMVGDRCEICEKRMKIWQSNLDDETKKKLGKDLKRKENWLVNVFVVKDPTNEANNGQLKMMRYGKQVDKIVDEAISGEDAEEFGARIFDLTKEGCNFRIKVEKNEGGYPTYVASKFLNASPIEGLTADKIEEIHNNIFELDKIFDSKDAAGISDMLKDHFRDGGSSDSDSDISSDTPTDEDTNKKMKDLVSGLTDDDNEEEEEEVESKKPKKAKAEKEETETETDEEDIDDKINDLLADLD